MNKSIFSKISKIIAIAAILIIFLGCLIIAILSNQQPLMDVDLSNYSKSNDVVSIQNLNVAALVSKDNVISVEETFDVKFNKEGLSEVVRMIPYASTSYYENKNGKVKKTYFVAKLDNLKGRGEQGEDFNVYIDEETGYLTFGLKNPSYFELGETRSFKISYDYDMGKDYNNGFDHVYFNLVGTNSVLTIDNVSFTVTLPEEIDDLSRIEMYAGKSGSTNTLPFVYSNKKITGSISQLGPLEGVTFRVVYDDGYLTGKNQVLPSNIIILVCSILAIVLAGFAFFKVRQRQKITIPIEVVRPEDLTIFEAEFLSKNKVSQKSIIAGIVVLASKGYLKIRQIGDMDQELVKLKDIDGKVEPALQALFNAIFEGGRQSRSINSLDLPFFNATNKILAGEKTSNSQKLYQEKPRKTHTIIKVITIILSVVSAILLFISPKQFLGFSSAVFSVPIFLVIFSMLLVLAFSSNRSGAWKYLIAPSLIMIGVVIYFYIGCGYRYLDPNYLFLISALIFIGAIFLLSGDSKYNFEGGKKKGRALGFEKFIKLCEVKQLKMFADENPNIYFDIIPYAYVYGLSDVWIKKLEGIQLANPEWFEVHGGGIFSTYVLMRSFDNMSRAYSATHAKILGANTNSSRGGGRMGGGFGGGGGFSGGGFGGGGFGAR